MQDMETQSLWSQVSGKAIMGPMENSELELFPSTMTTFEEFRNLYPNGLVLLKETRGLPGSTYDQYFNNRAKLGIFGRVDNFRRLRGKEMVVGIRYGGKQIAVTMKILKKKKFVKLIDLDIPVLVTYNESGNTIAAFSLENLSKDDLKNIEVFQNEIIIKGSNRHWQAATGQAETDDLETLKPVALTTAYWFAWVSFFPDTELKK